MTSNGQRQTDSDMAHRFENYGKPNNYGEPNTDRVFATDDKGALVMRVGVALILWALAIVMGAKAVTQWIASA
jgi:hypothetical protein